MRNDGTDREKVPAPQSSEEKASGPAGICVRVARAMSMLDIGKTKLYELVSEGELETIRIGRRTLILQASIDALVARLRSANSRRRID